MGRYSFFLVPFLLMAPAAAGTLPQQSGIPGELSECIARADLEAEYVLSADINPFYLRGDFDGDGTADYAAVFRKVGSGNSGIGICNAETFRLELLGPEVPLERSDGYVYKSFEFDAWMVYWTGSKEWTEVGGPQIPAKLIGEPIRIVWEESGSGMIYFDGERYRWHHLGQ